MEHFDNPYRPGDFTTSLSIENRNFFDDMLRRSREHRYYRHSFLTVPTERTPSREAVAFVLTSIYKIVSPFTGLLCSLGGRAPDLRSRFALMDNIYEEMGRGDLAAAHPNLYLKMLASIGVSRAQAEAERTLPIVRRMNEHLREVVDHRNFAVACAVLASVEAVIPPLFPILERLAVRACPEIDRTFFDRHGVRDEGHSDDASMLFAVTAETADYAVVDAEVTLDLEHRSELLDVWTAALESEQYVMSTVSERPRAASEMPARRGSIRPSHRPSVAPPSHRPSVPPPG